MIETLQGLNAQPDPLYLTLLAVSGLFLVDSCTRSSGLPLPIELCDGDSQKEGTGDRSQVTLLLALPSAIPSSFPVASSASPNQSSLPFRFGEAESCSNSWTWCGA